MAYPPHKRSDGKAAKAPNGKPITAHADCCDCGGGGGGDPVSPCSCFPIGYSDGRQCGPPDGSDPNAQSWRLVVDGSVTYSERVTNRNANGTDEVWSDVVSQTRPLSLTVDVPAGACSRLIVIPSQNFVQAATGPNAYGVPRTYMTAEFGNVPGNGGAGWSTIPRSSWNVTGPSIASDPTTNSVFFHAGRTDYGSAIDGVKIIGGGFGAGDIRVNGSAYQTRTASPFNAQTLILGTTGRSELASIFYDGLDAECTGSASWVRENCRYRFTHNTAGSYAGVRGSLRVTVGFSVAYTVTGQLYRCGTPERPGGGSTFVDPAVDAVFREYGKCRGCGDGNPMA